MSDYLPLYRPGDTLTFGVTADVVGGTPVDLSGDWAVKPAAADSTSVVGIAGHDAGIGDKVTVEVGAAVHELTASAAVTVGDHLAPAGSGKVKTVASGGLWLALASAAANAAVSALKL